MKRLRGCRTPDGEYCRPVGKEGVGPGARQTPFLSLGVKEALEAGVPGSVQDLPDRWSGRGSWEARPPGVNPHWGGSNTNEATVSQLRLRPLSNTLVGAQIPTTGVGEGVALQAQTWEGGWLDPGSLQGTGPKLLQVHCRGSHVARNRGSLGWACLTHTLLSYLAKALVFKVQRLDQ